MNIGYDGKRAVQNLTGLGNYSRLVVESIATAYPEHRLTLFAPKIVSNPRLERIHGLENVEIVGPQSSPLFPAIWRSFGVTSELSRHGIELYHGLSGELPLNIGRAAIPTVVTIHDLIYRILPQSFTAVDRFMCDYKYSRAVKAATRVIAISECTKRDIVRHYHVSEDKIDVIYQGCDESFGRIASRAEIQRVQALYPLPKRYLLQVGTIEERKNLELSIRALSALTSPSVADIGLVAVGRGGSHGYLEKMQRLAQELGVGERVVFLHDVPFTHLPLLYQGAEVVLYPSRYEGFGIPVLEGLRSRRPVVAATGSCLEEAGGAGTVYVNPDDARALADAVTTILADRALVQRMIEQGEEYSRRFDNANIPHSIMEVYRRAIDSYHAVK